MRSDAVHDDQMIKNREGTISSLTPSAGLFNDHFFLQAGGKQFYVVLSTLLPGRPEKSKPATPHESDSPSLLGIESLVIVTAEQYEQNVFLFK